ncbi:MAG: tyrosine-protein kinase family protein [bacterium]
MEKFLPNQFKPENPRNRFDGKGYHSDNAGNAEIGRLIAKLDTLCNGSLQQIVLITSAILGEGKSTVASRLARSSARNRKNPTLLIDFDLRRPRLHQLFGVRKRQGLVDIFDGRIPLRDCIKRTSIPGLMLLTSGRLRKETPIELLTADKIKTFFSEVRNSFDNVIVDSPPIIPVSDPLILGKIVDNVILVVKAGVTSRHIVKRAIDMFLDVKVSISGIVLNNMDNVLPYYYDSNYYGYKYYEKAETGSDL